MLDKNLNRYINYFEGEIPILLEMPHSGIFTMFTGDFPKSFGSKMNGAEFRRNIGFGCDVSVPAMTGFNGILRDLKPYGIYNNLARVYCDTNRSKEEVSGWALEGRDFFNHHHGIIWVRSILTGLDLSLPEEDLKKIVEERAQMAFKAPFNQEEFDTLMSQIYDPYHDIIKSFHKKIVAKFGYCIHVALHSMAPLSTKKIRGGYICGQKAERGTYGPSDNTLPDIILIHNNYDSANKILVDKIRRAFESGGLIVEDGQGPFLGNIGVTKKYGDPAKGVNVIGIEHVAHETEPSRHLGRIEINYVKAWSFQRHYQRAILNLLEE